MTTVPETRYATTADGTSVAYQTLGDGPPDVVLVRAFHTNVEHEWDDVVLARVMRRIATFGRLVLLDRRGMGLSDRPADEPTLETRADDIVAVLDALGSPRAWVVGLASGCESAVALAALRPERTSGIVLFHPEPHETALPAEELDAWVAGWGTRELAQQIAEGGAPSRAGDDALITWLADSQRRSASPAVARRLLGRDLDLTEVLPAVSVPTVVLARAGNADDWAAAQQVAELVPEARLEPLPGVDHMLISGDTEAAVDAIERAITGHVVTAPDLERVLATVLFTDLVSSTERLVKVGDAEWGQLIARHHAVVRDLLGRYRGVEQDTAGDGFFATFDGPARAVRCAQEIVAAVARLGLATRAGLHTGECEVVDGKMAGLAVVTAARVMATAEPGEVRVTSTVRDLVAGSTLSFEDLGEHRLKGVNELRRLFRASGA